MELNDNDITAAAYVLQNISLSDDSITINPRDRELLHLMLQNRKFLEAAQNRWEDIFTPEPYV